MSSLHFSQNMEWLRYGLGLVKMMREPSSAGPPRYVLPKPVSMRGAFLSKPFGHPEFSCSVFDVEVCIRRLAAVLIGSSVSSS